MWMSTMKIDSLYQKLDGMKQPLNSEILFW